ncbi:MAG: glycerol-3-phosphate 1-O-acyltransferase PlsY [Gemmatimonadaceae bacterium]|nr:glycerol-3-phosphate 1-O-acyltransferase PlsY [Gemmatimonadaceae bacterium]
MNPWVALGLAYAIGALPTAYLAGRLHGIDLRQHGSGNLGATNVVRVLGWPVGLVVYVIDCLKGFLPAWWLPIACRLAGPVAMWWAIAFGVAAIVGHVKPIWLLFRGGGKGVATASGVFFGLAPAATAGVTVLFLLIVALTRYVSLGSMLGALALPVFVYLDQGATPVFLISVAVGAFVVWTHRANIARLRAGTESKIGRAKAVPTAAKEVP